jgi:HK97 family phage major capsid protein
MSDHTPYQRTADIEKMGQDDLAKFVKSKTLEMAQMNEGGALKSASTEVIKSFQARNEELTAANQRLAALTVVNNEYNKRNDEYKSLFKEANRVLPFQTGGDPNDGGGAGEEFKSLGQQFVESPVYSKMMERCSPGGRPDPTMLSLKTAGNMEAEVKSFSMSSLKATMTTTAGWTPYPTLSPRPPVMTALQQPVVADLIPQDDITQPAVLYYEETAFSDNAGFVAEGGAKPQATLALTLRTVPLSKIAVHLPVTDEQMMDVPQVRGYIDQRLTLMIRRKEDAGLLVGTGTPPELQGFHTKSGIGSIARAANEDNSDAILRAITDINSIYGFANASGIIMHPLNWLAIRLLRTTTGDYIWGHPATMGPQTLWGLPVVPTAAETSGKAMVGDFQMYSHISRRTGIRIDVGYINDDFTLDIQRIRLEERLSLEIYRARAFEEVTGLN